MSSMTMISPSTTSGQPILQHTRTWLPSRPPTPPTRRQRGWCCSVKQTSVPEATVDANRLQKSIAVLGAGPAGLATAVALRSAGLPVTVLERRPAGAGGGTALGLWTSAWKALDALGAAEQLRQQHPALDRVELCREDGRLLRAFSLNQDCEGGPHEFRGVRRASLLEALEAQLPAGSVQYNCPVAGVDATPQGAAVLLAGGQRLPCLAVVAADGARSVALEAAGRRPPNYVGQTAIRGIAAYSSAAPVIRQIWGRGPRAGMYPISSDLCYWFCCFDAPAEGSAAPLQPADMKEEALRLLKGWQWDMQAVVEATLLENLSRSRIADRWDLPSSLGSGSLTLAGDALHPMTPNLGQGGGVALEDAVVLGRLLAAQAGLAERVADVAASSSSSSSSSYTSQREAAVSGIREAFRQYERLRLQRCLPITLRSWAFGELLQLPFPPVLLARDVFVQRLFSPAHFLSHAIYDCTSVSLE